MKKYSLLMSIYHKENPKYFNKALESIWDNQTLQPDEIILVEDGKLTDDLYSVIQLWKEKLQNILKIVPLETNQGLAKALNEGLKYCTCEYIARMDTDDICTSERFKNQIDFLERNKDIDILGGFIQEFDDNYNLIQKVTYPILNDEMKKFFGKRNPLAHMTVMFRKSFFEKAGVYPENTNLDEDTMFWFEGFKKDCKFANIPEVLVNVRVNSSFYKRRNGFKKSYSDFKNRINIIKELKLSYVNYIWGLARFIFMSLPFPKLTEFLYKKLRK